MSARALAAPLHRHTREDEYSYVLEGRMGALLGDEVLVGSPGDLVFKPRNQWHTFWNAGDEPAGFWRSSRRPALSDSSPNSSTSGASAGHPRRFWRISARATGSRWILRVFPGLVERFGLRFPGDPM